MGWSSKFSSLLGICWGATVACSTYSSSHLASQYVFKLQLFLLHQNHARAFSERGLPFGAGRGLGVGLGDSADGNARPSA